MFDTVIPLVPGLPGGPELLIVLFVLVLLFGANKIPKLARSTGQAMGEFQRGRQEIEDELEEMQQPPGETDRPETSATSASTSETERETTSNTDTASTTEDEETERETTSN